MSTHQRTNRGIYSCGNCNELGHTRDTCEKPERRRIVPGFVARNEGYQANRAAGICDGCGRASKRFVYCAKCRARRKRLPSRQREYRVKREYRRAK